MINLTWAIVQRYNYSLCKFPISRYFNLHSSNREKQTCPKYGKSVEEIRIKMEEGMCRWPLDPPAQWQNITNIQKYIHGDLRKLLEQFSYTVVILSFRESLYIYYAYTHTCRCINDNDDKINQQYIRIINITRYI